MEEKLTADNIEVARVTAAGYRILSREEVSELIARHSQV